MRARFRDRSLTKILSGPYTLNKDSPQAQGLVYWAPMLGYWGGIRGAVDLVNGLPFTVNNGLGVVTDARFGAVADFDNASDQYLTRTGVPRIPAPPVTMCCRMRWTSGTRNAMSISNAAGGKKHWIGVRFGNAVYRVKFGINSEEITAGVVTAGQWTHIAGRSLTTSDHAVFRDGANKGTGTNSVVTGGLSKLWIGREPAGDAFDGQLADCRWYVGALTDELIQIIADRALMWDLFYPLGRRTTILAPAAPPAVDTNINAFNFSLAPTGTEFTPEPAVTRAPVRLKPRLVTGVLPRHFTLAIIPDSHVTVSTTLIAAQVQWLRDNWAKERIVAALHVGDVVNDADETGWWDNAVSQYRTALDFKMPFAVSPGNWDMGSSIPPSANNRNTVNMNASSRFSRAAYADWFWWGNQYKEVDADEPSPPHPGEVFGVDNGYAFFDVGRLKFLIVWVEFGPTSRMMEWAVGIMRRYPNRRVIFLTHSHLGMIENMDVLMSADTDNPGSPREPTWHGIGSTAINGREVWRDYLRHVPNLDFTFSGHVWTGGYKGEGYLGPDAEGNPPTHVKNGAFAEGAYAWTAGANWSIAAGKATHSSGATATLKQTDACIKGCSYDVTFRVTGRTAGSVQVKLGTATGTSRSADGLYTETIVCAATPAKTDLELMPSSDFVGSIDDVVLTPEGAMGLSGNAVCNFKFNRYNAATGGRLGLLRFYPRLNRIEVQTYHTSTRKVFTDAAEQFNVQYGMAG